jgi:starch synthase
MLKVCFVSAEVAPVAKAGGLADVAAALLKFLHAAGHDVRLFMPAYALINRDKLMLQPVDFLQEQQVSIGTELCRFSVLTTTLPGSAAPLYLVDCPKYYSRAGIYGNAADEHRRFLLLMHAAFMSCQRMGFAPDILHCNDWHTAIGPLWLQTIYRWDQLFANTRSVFTIHNIGYQGIVSALSAGDFLPASDYHLLHQDDLKAGRINLMRTALLHADLLITVSPTYAREIQTPEYGLGMESVLLARRARLIGILNGVDYAEWDPRHDRYLPLQYAANQLGRKEQLKAQLVDKLPLQRAPRRLLVGMVTRLAEQKGIELLPAVLPELLETRDFSMVVLGSGEGRYEAFFAALARDFPDRVHFQRGYSEEMAHWIEAAADSFLMPSRYEPCGLNQLYSLRYGTVPIVRRTGGLADSVQHYDAATGLGTGIVFNDYDSNAVRWALNLALDLYQHRAQWKKLVQSAMAQDFSWQRQVRHYEFAYEQLLRPQI